MCVYVVPLSSQMNSLFCSHRYVNCGCDQKGAIRNAEVPQVSSREPCPPWLMSAAVVNENRIHHAQNMTYLRMENLTCFMENSHEERNSG